MVNNSYWELFALFNNMAPVASTVASQQQGPEFESTGQLSMFSLCFCLSTPAPSHSPKTG